jgi:hypothetical protein
MKKSTRKTDGKSLLASIIEDIKNNIKTQEASITINKERIQANFTFYFSQASDFLYKAILMKSALTNILGNISAEPYDADYLNDYWAKNIRDRESYIVTHRFQDSTNPLSNLQQRWNLEVQQDILNFMLRLNIKYGINKYEFFGS